MATFNGVNYALINAVPSVKVPPGEVSGDIQIAREEYTSAAALTAADVINLGIKLPPGRRVLRVIAIVPANGGTVDVGIAGATTKYIAAAAANATTEKVIDVAPNSVEENLIATIGGSPSAAGKYAFHVYHGKL